MNAEHLLEHFERLSEAPEAIPRLRRFIFDLAVRGKLVEQDPKDEPAAELLKLIQQQKVRLVREGIMRKHPVLSPIDSTILPFAAPSHWEWVPLCGIGIFSGGMTPSKSRSDFWEGSINWFSPKDIKSDELVESELKITSLGLSETGLQLYQPGCLFMVARSGILKRTFPVAINRVEAAANQDLKVFAPFMKGMDRYLQVMLKGMTDFILALTLVKTGTTVQSLKYEEFERLAVPLPPLAEQHRIVAKVDELMALCDQLVAAKAEREQSRDQLVRASLQRLNQPDHEESLRKHAGFVLGNLRRLTTRAEHIKQLRQTILNLAIRGKLVPQVSTDEPASALHRRLIAEITSFARERGSATPMVDPVTEEAVPFSLPSGWMWSRLASMFKVVTDGDHQPPPRAENGVAFLTIGNVTTGRLDFSNCRFVPQEYFDAIAPHRRPTKGDFLYTVVGATYGRPALVQTDRPFCVQRHIGILKPVNEIDLGYLHLLLSSPLIYDQATRSLTGTAQPTIPLRPLRNFLAPLPPLAEQERIVAKVRELMALCDSLEVQLGNAENDSGRLLEAVLHEALTAPALVEAA